MSAPTVAVEWLLARAAVRSVGLLHVVSRRDSGALNPVCGANPIRSREIETLAQLTDVAQLCDGCGAMAASLGGTVRDGVALLLGLSAAATTTRLLELPIEAVGARQDHARREAGAGIDELIDSITERGVVTPLIVRRHGRRFEIIDGARRLYAAAVAGLTTIPAIVRDATDTDVLVDGLVANLHRADLSPIDQAHAYQHALEALSCSKAELGRRLGISREQVSNTIRLLALPEEDQARLAAGDLTAEGGRALLRGQQPAASKLTDISGLLAQLLDAKVAVTARGDRTRIVIDVADGDRDRILAQLGATAVAA
jgi:ParB/RepB/Spo0J family partition protein